MRWLRQSTSADVPIGPFVDSTDGFTAETALTITQPDIRLKKNAGAWAQKNAAQTLTHEENGYYEVTLDATDTNTLGLLRLAVNESGALPVWEDFLVVPANVYDSMVAGSDTLDVTVTAMGTNTVTAAALATDAVTEIQSGLATAAALDAVDNFIDTEIADIQARLPAALVGGRMDCNVGAISGDATAADNLETAFDDTAGPVPWAGIIDQGTAQAATGTTLQLRAGASFANDEIIGAIITITGGSAGVGQARQITDYVSSTDTATVDAWTTTPTGTITYKVTTCPPAPATPPDVNVARISGDATAADNLEAACDGTGFNVGGGQVVAASVTGAVGTVNALANNSVTAAALAADAVTEIQSGLATAAALDAVDNFVDTEVAAIKAVTDKLDTALELDVSVYRFTTNALENAPAGGGGGTDWTAGEREQIRHRLGIDGTATAPSTGTPSLATAAALDAVDNFIDTEIADIQARLPAALVGGRMDASVGAMQANVMTAAAAAADLTTELQSGLATAAAVAALPTAAAIADAVWDEQVDGTVTARQSVRLANSANGGKASGLGTTTVALRDLADTKDRVTATVDADGNRTAVARDLT